MGTSKRTQWKIGILNLFAGLMFSTAQTYANEFDFSEVVNLSTQKKMSEEIKEEKLVLYFWATWCGDCKAKLKGDLTRYNTKGSRIFAISTEKDQEKVQDFLNQLKPSVPLYFDPSKSAQKKLKVFAVPTVVLLQKTQSGYEVLLRETGSNWEKLDKQLNGEKGT